MPTFDGDIQRLASWKGKVVRDNPHIVDEYFYTRVKALFETVFSNQNGAISLEWLWYRIEYQGKRAPHVHGCFRINGDSSLTKHVDKV